jgi:hypothetical protein
MCSQVAQHRDPAGAGGEDPDGVRQGGRAVAADQQVAARLQDLQTGEDGFSGTCITLIYFIYIIYFILLMCNP